MNEFKGTPGPWEVGDELRVYGGNGLYIFRSAMGIEYQITQSNVNLIAAAPELLEALQDALHAHDKHGEFSEWDFARAAINKALGK